MRLIEIVIPVYNEEAALAASVRRLRDYLEADFPFAWRITIADNGSTDRTPRIAAGLARSLRNVELLECSAKGRGLALREAWLRSDADVVCYMDVDLSTDLRGLLPLVAPLVSGHSDVAIGTRLAPGARVVRGRKRELISRAYNKLLHATLAARFSDAQCGFKAMRADVARRLLPDVQDDAWFFDTEVLMLAQREGLRIHEVPVDWVDDPDSRVDIVRTALDDLHGIVRLLASARLIRFAFIGVCSTLAYAVLLVLLRAPLGVGPANAAALAVTAIGNTQANRWLTFRVRGRAELIRHHIRGALVYALTLGLTLGSLAALHAVDSSPPQWLELSVLVVASASATVSRYIALRTWVFARERRGLLRRSVTA
jgi:putative flippase GtrA